MENDAKMQKKVRNMISDLNIGQFVSNSELLLKKKAQSYSYLQAVSEVSEHMLSFAEGLMSVNIQSSSYSLKFDDDSFEAGLSIECYEDKWGEEHRVPDIDHLWFASESFKTPHGRVEEYTRIQQWLKMVSEILAGIKSGDHYNEIYGEAAE